MRVSVLEKILHEYRPSAKLIVTVDGRPRLEMTVAELQSRLMQLMTPGLTPSQNFFIYGREPSILRERRADTTLSLARQAEMMFRGPYEAEWLELECR